MVAAGGISSGSKNWWIWMDFGIIRVSNAEVATVESQDRQRIFGSRKMTCGEVLLFDVCSTLGRQVFPGFLHKHVDVIDHYLLHRHIDVIDRHFLHNHMDAIEQCFL